MPDIRIKDLPETLDVESDDYVAVDNAGDGTRKYTLRQLIASVGAPEFVVNINASGDADKTLSDITGAIASGYIPVAVYNDEYYQLTKTTETSATFTKYNELGEMVSISVGEGYVLTEESALTSDDVTNRSGVNGQTVSYALDDLSNNIGYLSDRVNDAVNDVADMRDDVADLDSRVTVLEASSGGGSGDGLTQAEKDLILTLFAKAAYAEDDANNYYAQLESLWDTSDKTFTYNLTNCTINNPISTIAYGNRYTGTIGVQQGYSLNLATVTMGGVNITATSYSSGTITIPSVTGDVVITATAVLAAESITATYTQSGAVYDTDSLDSLKADLVVTANYAGGTSETVTGYTLSGTLTVGTSTITVEYAGLTDTFNVSVSVYVDPPAYELASATTFDGTSDYVDTGYVLTNTDKNFSIAIEFEPNAPADGATLFDTSHNGSGAFQFWLQSNGSGNYRGQLVATGVTLFNKSALTTNAKVVFVHTVGESTINAYISLDGGAKQTVTITLSDFGTNANYLSTTQHLILGARYNLTERFFKGTINKFAVYEYVMAESAIDAFLGVS